MNLRELKKIVKYCYQCPFFYSDCDYSFEKCMLDGHYKDNIGAVTSEGSINGLKVDKRCPLLKLKKECVEDIIRVYKENYI